MKTVEELIQESIIEIETNQKPMIQVFNELVQILNKRHSEAYKGLDNQRLKEIKVLEDRLKTTQNHIYNIRIDISNMSLNLISEQLR